ncbi:hypothetical protein OBBRIDRAFT_827808 [Obba rivulosa]|uniref:DUF6533 domain-containing protein n=1 Tax=Obba rivulosa TaxID=1052685 RepID=A0A8E2DHT2_9APHY|nr:hypothetical protein OBBRIDRAFT_827808 [Obba rivulosa]
MLEFESDIWIKSDGSVLLVPDIILISGTTAAAMLVLHDHMCSLWQEVEFMWGRKWTSVTVLFYLNRWGIFVWALLQVVLMINKTTSSSSSCMILGFFQVAIITLLDVTWAAFSAVRIYAISGGRWCLAALVISLNIVSIGMFLNLNVSQVSVSLDCTGTFFGKDQCMSFCEGGIMSSLTSQICTLVALLSDFTVLLITCYKTYAIRGVTMLNRSNTTLGTALLRDGTVYFCASVLSTVTMISARYSGNAHMAPMSAFYQPCQSIIMSHFLMNLRQAANDTQDDTLDASRPSFVRSPRSSLRFATFVDNLGEELVHGLEDGEPDVELPDNDPNAALSDHDRELTSIDRDYCSASIAEA